MKRYETDWEKIFAKHVSDEGFISIIYKELSKLSQKISPILNCVKKLNNTSPKKITQMTKKVHKKSLGKQNLNPNEIPHNY